MASFYLIKTTILLEPELKNLSVKTHIELRLFLVKPHARIARNPYHRYLSCLALRPSFY